MKKKTNQLSKPKAGQNDVDQEHCVYERVLQWGSIQAPNN